MLFVNELGVKFVRNVETVKGLHKDASNTFPNFDLWLFAFGDAICDMHTKAWAIKWMLEPVSMESNNASD
jgi:hypothetical protein